MCGRTCLTLEPHEIQDCCKYLQAGEKDDYKKPEWRAEFNCGRTYKPSFNIAPTDVTPVLVSSEHFDLEGNPGDRVLIPMVWGMIPFWHKGDPKKHGLTTNNCRLEHMLESKLYCSPFRKGQRCVILCEGFYEWQTTKTNKPSERAAHYIFMPQKEDTLMYDKKSWSKDGINLLKLAGLFDVWKNEDGDKIFSYSVITYESEQLLSWLHHRTPAILETDEQVDNWLNFSQISDDTSLKVLRKPIQKLIWYQVSNMVNNSRNKSDDCNKPLTEILKTKKLCTPKSKIMQSWLIIRKRKEEEIEKECKVSDDEDSEPVNKKQKFNKTNKEASPNLAKNKSNQLSPKAENEN